VRTFHDGISASSLMDTGDMNHSNLFPSLPDAARVWVYAAQTPLPLTVQNHLLDLIHTFMVGWRSHGRVTLGEAAILHNRFIVAGGILESGGTLSGCSIDSLTRAIESAAQTCGVSLGSPLKIFWRSSDGHIQSASRGAFRRLVRAGKVTLDTPVFDLAISELNMLRTAFEKPFGRSWHARLFKQPMPA